MPATCVVIVVCGSGTEAAETGRYCGCSGAARLSISVATQTRQPGSISLYLDFGNMVAVAGSTI
jgi:hypothetical protein